MLLNPVTFHAPKDLDELTKLHASLENARIQAGGTFLLNALKMLKRKGAKTPEHIISLNKVAELKGIEHQDDQLIIKAMTTISEIFDTPLEDNFAVLHQVCRNISTQPIRNMATIGGNLTCRYTWTEMPAAMMGLRATLHFTDDQGQKEELSAEEFYAKGAKTDKIFTHVSVPRDKSASIAYRRIKKSQFVDIPLLSLMVNTHPRNGTFNDTIVSLNNCVAFAQRDTQLEDFLNGKNFEGALAEKALEHLTDEIYDKRSSDYKKHMFRVCLREAIEEIIERQ